MLRFNYIVTTGCNCSLCSIACHNCCSNHLNFVVLDSSLGYLLIQIAHNYSPDNIGQVVNPITTSYITASYHSNFITNCFRSIVTADLSYPPTIISRLDYRSITAAGQHHSFMLQLFESA